MDELDIVTDYAGKSSSDTMPAADWNALLALIQTKVNALVTLGNNQSNFYVDGVMTYPTDGVITLTAGSSYTLEGTLYGEVIVDATTQPDDNTYIQLKGVNIISTEDSGIKYETPTDNTGYKDLVITLEKDTINHVICTTVAEAADDQEACVYSMNNMTIQGTGYLSCINKGGHGIKASELRFTGGNYYVEAIHDAFHGGSIIDLDHGNFFINKANDGFGTGDTGIINIFGGTYYGYNISEQFFDGQSSTNIFNKNHTISGTSVASDDQYTNKVEVYDSPTTYYSGVGVYAVNRVTFTAGVTTAGDITLTLGGTDNTVTLTTDYSTAALVAAYVATLTFTDWTVSYTDGNAYVDFTYSSYGAVSTPTFTDTDSTGVTATATTTTKGSYCTLTQYDSITKNDDGSWTGTGTVLETDDDGIYQVTSLYVDIEGYVESPINIADSYSDITFRLGGAYIENSDSLVPAIDYQSSDGKLKIYSAADTINVISNTETGDITSYDLDAIKSENNISIEVKNGSHLFVTSAQDDGIDGDDVKMTDSKGVLLVMNCGGRGIKGSCIIIGGNDSSNSNDSLETEFITDDTDDDYSEMQGSIVCVNNSTEHDLSVGVTEDDNSDYKNYGYCDIYARNGKYSKGTFNISDTCTIGVCICDSIGACIGFQMDNATNLYYTTMVDEGSLGIEDDCGITYNEYLAAPYKRALIGK